MFLGGLVEIINRNIPEHGPVVRGGRLCPRPRAFFSCAPEGWCARGGFPGLLCVYEARCGRAGSSLCVCLGDVACALRRDRLEQLERKRERERKLREQQKELREQKERERRAEERRKEREARREGVCCPVRGWPWGGATPGRAAGRVSEAAAERALPVPPPVCPMRQCLHITGRPGRTTGRRGRRATGAAARPGHRARGSSWETAGSQVRPRWALGFPTAGWQPEHRLVWRGC